MISKKGKHYKNKKESYKDIANRILKLTEQGDYFPFAPPMKAQTALNELCRFFLGEDYWTIVNNNEQANTEIVFEIECRYKNKVR